MDPSTEIRPHIIINHHCPFTKALKKIPGFLEFCLLVFIDSHGDKH